MHFLTKHLDETEETYFQHMRFALSFSGHMLIGATACAIHAFMPFLFESTGSRRIKYLHERMVLMRAQMKNPTFDSSEKPIENAVARGFE